MWAEIKLGRRWTSDLWVARVFLEPVQKRAPQIPCLGVDIEARAGAS
jgi:hypothetical protein